MRPLYQKGLLLAISPHMRPSPGVVGTPRDSTHTEAHFAITSRAAVTRRRTVARFAAHGSALAITSRAAVSGRRHAPRQQAARLKLGPERGRDALVHQRDVRAHLGLALAAGDHTAHRAVRERELAPRGGRRGRRPTTVCSFCGSGEEDHLCTNRSRSIDRSIDPARSAAADDGGGFFS